MSPGMSPTRIGNDGGNIRQQHQDSVYAAEQKRPESRHLMGYYPNRITNPLVSICPLADLRNFQCYWWL